MNLAKISSNGQITIPLEIRNLLELKEGDKILFVQKRSGEVVIRNSSRIEILDAQKDLAELDISDEDILKEVLSLRYGPSK